jgi:hypothetical protein
MGGAMTDKRSQTVIKGTLVAVGKTSTTADNLEKGKLVGSSSTSAPREDGEAVVNMMWWLNLTPKEAAPLILDDEGDADLPCPKWTLVGKVLAPNTLHINTIWIMKEFHFETCSDLNYP